MATTTTTKVRKNMKKCLVI